MSWWTLCTSSRLSANQHINSWIYILGCQLFRISLHLWLLGKHDTSTTNKSSFECQWMKQGKKTTRDTRKIASCIWNINHYNYIIKPQKIPKIYARATRAQSTSNWCIRDHDQWQPHGWRWWRLELVRSSKFTFQFYTQINSQLAFVC